MTDEERKMEAVLAALRMPERDFEAEDFLMFADAILAADAASPNARHRLQGGPRELQSLMGSLLKSSPPTPHAASTDLTLHDADAERCSSDDANEIDLSGLMRHLCNFKHI